MPLRKYQATTNKDEQVVTTGDGQTLVRGTGTTGCTYCFLPPPDDGNCYGMLGSYWFGPFTINSNGYLAISINNQQTYPAIEGLEE